MTQFAGSLLPPPGAVPLAAQLLQADELRLNPPPLTEQQQRAQFVDFQIAQNRANIPESVRQIIAEKRQRTRLTIRDIQGLSENTMRDAMRPAHDTDFRSPIVRVLDLIDLPRNSIANIAFGDPNALGLLGGLAETSALFAGFGAIVGQLPGAAVGAAAGAAIFLVGTALAGIARAFGGDEPLAQRLDLLERGAFGQPKLFASDVLEQLGVENKVVRAIVGFGGDVLLDPLTYIGGGGATIRLSSVAGGGGVSLFLRSPARRVLEPLTKEALGAGPRVGQAVGISHPLAVLFERSEAFGNFFGDSTNGVNRLGELLKSSRENFAARNAGIMSSATFRQNQKVLTNQMLQEIAFFAGTDLRGRPSLDLLKQRAAQEFVREFSQKSALNISFPFAGMIANRFHTVLGGKSLQIPAGQVGKPGKISKALGESQDEFAARIIADAETTKNIANLERDALIEGVTLVGPATPDVANALPEFQDDIARLIAREENIAAEAGPDVVAEIPSITVPLGSLPPGLREELRSVHGFEVVSTTDLDLGRVDELTQTIARFDNTSRVEQIAQKQIDLLRITGAVEDETKLRNKLQNLETDPTNPAVFLDKVNENLDRQIGLQQLTNLELMRLHTPQVLDVLNAADNVVSASSRGDMLTSYRGFAGVFRKMYADRFSKIAALYRSKESVSNITNLKARNYIIGRDEALKRLKILDPDGTGIKTTNNLSIKLTDLADDVRIVKEADAGAAAGADVATALPTAPRILANLPADVPYKAPTGQTVVLNFEDPLDYYAWLLRKSNKPIDAFLKSQRREASLYLRRVFGAHPSKQGVKAKKAGTIDPEKIAEKVLAEVESIFGKVTAGKKATKAKKAGAAEEFDEIIEIPASDSALRRREVPLTDLQRAKIAGEVDIQFEQVSAAIREAQIIEDDVLRAQTSIKELDRVADAELANLTGQIEELEGQLFWRTAARLADLQKNLRDVTNVGRKLKQANEPARVFRVANENVLPQKVAEVTRSFHARIRSFQKRTGGKIPSEDWSLAVRGKMQKILEAEAGGALKGYPEGHDVFWDQYQKRIVRNPEYRTAEGNMLLDSPELNELAEEGIIILHSIDEAELNLGIRARDYDPTWIYLPLRLTEKAQEVARRLGIEADEFFQAAAAGRKLTTNQPANLRRITNRHPYPGDIDPRVRMSERPAGNAYIWSGELSNRFGDTKWPYNIEREAYINLNFNQDNMLPGDLWDRGFKSNPRANSAGERWHPPAFATSPEELNLQRHKFMRAVGEEFTGPIFETDFLNALTSRLGEHLRAISASNLSHMIAPHVRTVPSSRMKFLPRGTSGNTRVIDGVEMRPINAKKVGKHNLLKVPLPENPEGSVVLWPEDLASAIEDFAGHYKTDADVNKILQAVDFTISGWKMSVLLKPAWAMVNMIGGAVLAGLAGIRFNEVPKLMGQLTALNLKVHGLNKQPFGFVQNIPVGNQLLSEHNIWEQAIEDGIASASRTTQELVPWMRMGTPESKTFFGALLHGDEKHQGKWYMRAIGKWFQVNAALDDQWRLATWVDLRNQGFSRADATSKVHRYLFDWGDFTRTEREWGPRVWPFYRWMRSNIAIQMKTVLEKPQFAASFPKVLEALEEGLVDEEAIPPYLRPRWMRDAMAIHISANPKSARFLLMGSLTPAQEIFEIGAGVMGQEGFGDFMNYFVSSSNPLVKSAFEIAAGVNIFTGQGIGDPAMGETSVPEHLGRQTGTIGSLFRGVFHPVRTVERIIDDPVRETIRFLVGGRFQQKDISSLVAQKRFEEGETLNTLRAGIKRARRDEDQEEAERLATIAIDRYHMMYNLGFTNFPPKFLQGIFRREQFLKNQQQQNP